MNDAPSPPNRGIALLLAVIGPQGIGQLYLGQTRRALLWAASSFGSFVLILWALVALGPSWGFRWLLIATIVLFFALPLGAIVDVLFVPRSRVRRVSWLVVAGFWIGLVVMSVAARLTARALVLEAFKIPAASMAPTLLVGDHIMVSKSAYSGHVPARGDVVVFPFPEHPEQDFVKRVIAVPGDSLLVKNGRPFINGWEVPRCTVGRATFAFGEDESTGDLEVEYLGDAAYLTFYDVNGGIAELQGPFEVPSGEVWVLGDNRHNSHDSRYWRGMRGAGVRADAIKGRALFRWLTVTPRGVDFPRFGTPVDGALAPSNLSGELREALARCLATRPPRERTSPPARGASL